MTHQQLDHQQLDHQQLDHQFAGVHYLANMVGCNRGALLDIYRLRKVLRRGIKKSGATIVGCCDHVFNGGGWTCVYVLSESHASIHTYPEHESCFVDLFTCGENCDYHPFEEELKNYLTPSVINQQVIVRNERVEKPP